MSGARVAFDIGGTFTDVVVASPDGEIRTFKLLSLPERIATEIRARIEAVLEASGEAGVESLVHGTTIASNALLEGKGALTGLITTEGFRDELELRRLARPAVFDYRWERTPPLIPRRRRVEVPERIGADAVVRVPLDLDKARAALLSLKRKGVEALAICLINAYVNPTHEAELEMLARELLPGIPVCKSSDVLPEIREYERTSTTCVNAYLMPVARRYLDSLERELGGFHQALRVMQSNGGVMTAEHARHYPVFLVESGPAAGVVGTAVLTRELGLGQAVSFDMGGTTVKACLIEDSTPVEKNTMEVGGAANAATRYSRGAGYSVSVPALDIVEAGAGGGSIAWIDDGGALRVGPTSAGAVPGPVCYGNGGSEPTITDANVVLGYMNPVAIAGESVAIDRDAAVASFERVLCPRLALSALEAAHGVHTVANAAMMRAIRAVTTERGRDPRELTLIAFGGAGPIHAVGLAEMLEMKRVVVPLHPGVFSALGLLLADLRYDYVRSIPGPLDALDLDGIAGRYDALEDRVRADIAKEGLDPATLHLERSLDLRYRGQTAELTLPLPVSTGGSLERATLSQAFHAEHERSFGYRCPKEPLFVVNLRLKAIAPSHSIRLTDAAAAFLRSASSASTAPVTRPAYFGRGIGERETAIVSRAALVANARIGPVIVEEFDTTVVVPPGWSAELDACASIVLNRVGPGDTP